MDRIHQFTRCIEGLLCTSSGNSKARFKSRTELFVGPAHHDTMDTIYNIRSEVEHLHEDRRLHPFNRPPRMEIAKMEIIVGELARHVLSNILRDPEMVLRLGSREKLEAFWSLEPKKRQEIWHAQYDLLKPINGLREDNISDHDLGLESN